MDIDTSTNSVETSVETADAAPSTVSDSGASPLSSGVETATEPAITSQETASSDSGAVSGGTAETWTHGGWDGEYDSLPDNIRSLMDKKRNDLDSGYTQKFQKLSEERKLWEQERDDFTLTRAGLEDDLQLYKALSTGIEDPRLQEIQKELETLQGTHQTQSSAYSALKTEYDEFQDQVDKEWADGFAKTHSEIFDDAKKKDEFFDLIDEGAWTPESAVELVGQGEEIQQAAKELITKLGLPTSGYEFAVKYVKKELGVEAPVRKPRVSATLTSGANGAVNPATARGGTIRDMSKLDARKEASRRALRTSKKSNRK